MKTLMLSLLILLTYSCTKNTPLVKEQRNVRNNFRYSIGDGTFNATALYPEFYEETNTLFISAQTNTGVINNEVIITVENTNIGFNNLNLPSTAFYYDWSSGNCITYQIDLTKTNYVNLTTLTSNVIVSTFEATFYNGTDTVKIYNCTFSFNH